MPANNFWGGLGMGAGGANLGQVPNQPQSPYGNYDPMNPGLTFGGGASMGPTTTPSFAPTSNYGANFMDNINAMGGVMGDNYGSDGHLAALGQYHQERGTGNPSATLQGMMGPITQGERTVTADQYPSWAQAQTGANPTGGFGGVGAGTNTGGGGIDHSIYNRNGPGWQAREAAAGGLGMGAGGTPPPMGGGGSVGGGAGGGAIGGPGQWGGTPGTGGGLGNSFTQNPFYSSMADDITRRVNQSRDQGLSQIRTNNVGLGMLGGSRQGIAEGQAISGAADNLAGQLGALGGGLYNADQNRDLSRYQGDQGFFTAQRGQDYQGIGLGADLMSRGLQTQWQPINNANGVYSAYTGFGTNNTNQQTGGGWMGALGGGLGMAQFGQNMGWWGK